LSSAPFDTSKGCATCKHNTQANSTLFSETVEGSLCMDNECWYDHVLAYMEQKRKQLAAERYNCIYLDYQKRPDTYATVFEGGKDGVGSEQLHTRCKACSLFGAILYTSPDRQGEVDDDICFNPECLNAKKAAYAETLKIQSEEKKDSAMPRQSGGIKQPAAKTRKNSCQAPSVPRAIEECVDGFYRELSAAVVEKDSKVFLCVTAYALLSDAGFPNSETLGIKAPTMSTRAKCLEQLWEFRIDELKNLLRRAAGHVAGHGTQGGGCSEEFTKASEMLVKITDTQLTGRFRLDEKFLKAHTKSGIEALMKEAHFDSWLDKQEGKGAFSKLLKTGKDELIQTILKSKCPHFKEFVPTTVSSRLQKKNGR